MKAGVYMDEKYTLEQIVSAITQADDELICAIQYGDQEGIEDVMRDYLKENPIIKA